MWLCHLVAPRAIGLKDSNQGHVLAADGQRRAAVLQFLARRWEVAMVVMQQQEQFVLSLGQAEIQISRLAALGVVMRRRVAFQCC